jgi:hypothetical protein
VANPDTGAVESIEDLSTSGDEAHQPASVALTTEGATYSGGTVLRRPATRDDIVEVPTNLPRCGYNLNCANFNLMSVPFEITNGHSTEARVVHLTFSRQFPTRSASLQQSGTGSEITGLSAQLYSDAMPTGIPCQISKNWHSGANAGEREEYLRCPLTTDIHNTMCIV